MPSPQLSPWKHKLHEVIFEADTPAGKAFDLSLLAAILVSVAVVSLDSVAQFRAAHGTLLQTVEWTVTALFTVEYLLRLLAVKRPLRYMLSFFGLVDLLALLPTFLSPFFAGSHSLAVVRALRLLRIFRILKAARYVREAQVLGQALKASGRKITVFMGAVLSLVLIIGALMYMVEGEDSGFTSIPQSMYWAVVTMTTVGYGDVAPVTAFGKLIASIVMLLGYGVLAVPTGIVGSELIGPQSLKRVTTQNCPSCTLEGHDPDAKHCKHCGERLEG